MVQIQTKLGYFDGDERDKAEVIIKQGSGGVTVKQSNHDKLVEFLIK
jgi:hypothetical protein